MSVALLDAAQTAARLPYPALARAIADMLAELRAGTAMAPPRIALPVGDPAGGEGTLLVMPARNRELVMTRTSPCTQAIRNAACPISSARWWWPTPIPDAGWRCWTAPP